MTDSLSLIYSTFGSAEEARCVARTLLQEKLIACANHFAPIVSQYEFQGVFHEEQEFPLLLKTTTDQVKAATERLLALHSFDTPAILHWSASTSSPDYEKWLRGQVANQTR